MIVHNSQIDDRLTYGWKLVLVKSLSRLKMDSSVKGGRVRVTKLYGVFVYFLNQIISTVMLYTTHTNKNLTDSTQVVELFSVC